VVELWLKASAQACNHNRKLPRATKAIPARRRPGRAHALLQRKIPVSTSSRVTQPNKTAVSSAEDRVVGSI